MANTINIFLRDSARPAHNAVQSPKIKAARRIPYRAVLLRKLAFLLVWWGRLRDSTNTIVRFTLLVLLETYRQSHETNTAHDVIHVSIVTHT